MIVKAVGFEKFCLVLSVFMFLSCGILNNYVYADVADQVDLYIDSNDYSGCIKFLEEKKADTAEADQLFFIEYQLAKIKSNYLDFLESDQDWESYYEKADVFNQQIIDSAYKYASHEVSGELIDLQRLAQKAYLRDDDEESAQKVFDDFVNNVIAYTQRTGDTAKFKEIATLVAEEGHKRYFDQLFKAYKKFLTENNSGAESADKLLEIADEFLNEGYNDMAIVIYSHYVDFALSNYSKEKAVSAVKDICDRFRDYGFVPGVNPDFAEKIYEKAQNNFGPEIFTETEVIERGMNLEALGDYSRAHDEYKYFIKKFADSKYIDQIYCRMAIINLFCLGEADRGLEFLNILTTEYENSGYCSFALYYAGLIKQFRQDNQSALELYNKIVEKNQGFVEQAESRKREINTNISIDENVRYPLTIILDDYDSSVMVTLKPDKSKAFTGEDIVWSASAQDFSVGTVQPLFKYNWYWDGGSVSVPTNSPEFTTRYSSSGPKMICFGAQGSGDENVVCRSLWVYDYTSGGDGKKIAKVGEEIEFEPELVPACFQEKDMNFAWKINGSDGTVVVDGKKFKHKFEKPGMYVADLEMTINDKKFIKKFELDIVE